jgi:hypothetical protein
MWLCESYSLQKNPRWLTSLCEALHSSIIAPISIISRCFNYLSLNTAVRAKKGSMQDFKATIVLSTEGLFKNMW